MNVTIDANRTITINADTPAEALALRYWLDGYRPNAAGVDSDISLSTLVIDTTLYPKEPTYG